MKVGFTGTQEGMTKHQQFSVWNVLHDHKCTEFHHGDCIGADHEAAFIAEHEGHRVVSHPPDNPSKRAFFRGDVVMVEKPYLERNHDIVNAVDLMVATPKETEEQLRSGTWATIRYAKKQGKPLAIIYPDGTTEIHNDPRTSMELDKE